MGHAALDAAAIVGLLADDERRRVLAAIELGHSTFDAVVAATSLPAARVAKAVGRLSESGLVAQRDAVLHVDGKAFQAAARDALTRPPSDEHANAPGDAHACCRRSSSMAASRPSRPPMPSASC